MAKASITKRTVDAAKPGLRDAFLWDAEVAGFGLKVTSAGRKVYVFQYRLARPGESSRTPAKRYTIGKHGSLTPEQARKRAKELAALVESGIDPRERELAEMVAKDEATRRAAEKVRLEGELAFERVAALWLDHYENEKERRPSSIRMAKMIVNNHLQPALVGIPMPHIGRAELQPILDAIPVKQRGMRRAVFAYASVLFGWAHKRGDIGENPLAGMVKPEAPKARDRVLTDSELAEVWNACDSVGAPFGPFYHMLILTGQRRSEVAAMGWEELDRATAVWTIPADRAKNGVAHIVPLSMAVIAKLDGLAGTPTSHDVESEDVTWPKKGYVFTTTGKTPISGLTKAKRALDSQVAKARKGDQIEDAPAISPWRIHDLRRTMATGFQRLGIRFEVTEAVLNHISGAKGGVAGIYQRHDWGPEKRSALDAWAKHVAAIVAPADQDNVVSLDTAKRSA